MNKYFEQMKLLIVSSLVITTSITSHLISFNLIYIKEIAFIPSSVSYMLVFSLMDYLSASHNRKIVITLIIMESLANLIFILFVKATLILTGTSPLSSSLNQLLFYFSDMYLSNLLGSLVALIANYILFNILYKKNNFFTSSLVSSLFLILVYTPITDYFAFSNYGDINYFSLITVNILTNVLSFIFWTAILSVILKKEEKNV